MFFLLIIAKKKLFLCVVPNKFFPKAKSVVGQFQIVRFDGKYFARRHCRVGKPPKVCPVGIFERVAVVKYSLAGDLQALDFANFFGLQYNGRRHTRVLDYLLRVAGVVMGLYDEDVVLRVVCVETVAAIRLTAAARGEGQHVVLLDEVYELLVYHFFLVNDNRRLAVAFSLNINYRQFKRQFLFVNGNRRLAAAFSLNINYRQFRRQLPSISLL